MVEEKKSELYVYTAELYLNVHSAIQILNNLDIGVIGFQLGFLSLLGSLVDLDVGRVGSEIP